MLATLKELLTSKKFLAYLTTLLVVIGNKVAGHFGYELDDAQVGTLVAAAAAYIVGQGIADHGSTAAAIHAESRAAVTGPDVTAPTVTNTIEVSK